MIKFAYEVLSDRTKRSIYDLDGEQEVQNYINAMEGGYADQRY